MDKYEVVLFCAILAFLILLVCYLLNYQKSMEARAEPVTTEIPEFNAKCTKFSFTLNICEEYTIYRITRN